MNAALQAPHSPAAGGDGPRAFYPLTDFPWLAPLQRGFELVREELAATPAWVSWGSDAAGADGRCMFLSGEWTVYPVYIGRVDGPERLFGRPGWGDDAQALCAALPALFPRTTALLRCMPEVNYAGFTRLHARSRLAPHRHVNPGALIAHVALVLPEGGACGLRVGGQEHLWRAPGEAVVFDDNLEHSAWNDTGGERILLYVDFARPAPRPRAQPAERPRTALRRAWQAARALAHGLGRRARDDREPR